jgi:hypothetical protein
VGVFRPARGAYDLVFDTTSRRAAGRFAFRFWVNDLSPPSARLVSRTVRSGKLLLLRVTDRGSGVDPSTLLARVDGSYRRLIWDKAHNLVGVRIPGLAAGSHKLVFSVSDYQEAKNNENDGATLPNTRKLTTSFAIR